MLASNCSGHCTATPTAAGLWGISFCFFIMTSPDAFTLLRTVASLSPIPLQLFPWVSLCTLHCLQLVHFLNIFTYNRFNCQFFICQKLMHSQAWRQPVKCRTIYNARSVHASAGLVLLLPCHLDEVSLQTHGRSLFLKAPTMHPVCSVEMEKRPKCLRECKILHWFLLPTLVIFCFVFFFTQMTSAAVWCIV